MCFLMQLVACSEKEESFIYSTNKDNIVLLTPTDLKGNALEQFQSEKISIYKINDSGKRELVDNSKVSFSIDNDIASISNDGTITSKGSGSAKLTCAIDDQKLEIDVQIYNPIYDASDLDFLSLVSYEKEKAVAEKYLSESYMLMNDIDYSNHIRNYILPIASPRANYSYFYTRPSGSTLYSSTNYFFMGTLHWDFGTYYSYAWKDILGLTDAIKEVPISHKDATKVEAHYLTNSDKAKYDADVVGKEFKGINPHNLVFKGKINGNGYAIKNAYYMADNLHGGVQGDTGNNYFNSGSCFIGTNEGTIENLEVHIKVANPKTIYNNGKYIESSAIVDDSIGKKYDIRMMVEKDSINYAPYNKASDDRSGGSAFVGFNNGTIKNVYYNVSLNHAESFNSGFASAGVLTSWNGGDIKDCVVNLSAKEAIHSATLAVATFKVDDKVIPAKQIGQFGIEKIKGSNISGCYSIYGREASSNKKATCQAVVLTNIYSLLTLGEIDVCSKKIYANNLGDGVYQKNIGAMIVDAKSNDNLSKDIWGLDLANFGIDIIEGNVLKK